MGVIDELLPRATLESIQVFLVMAGILMIVFIITPIMIIPTALLGLMFYVFRVIYLKTVQDVKRLEGISKYYVSLKFLSKAQPRQGFNLKY